jgi:hypothetical protein
MARNCDLDTLGMETRQGLNFQYALIKAKYQNALPSCFQTSGYPVFFELKRAIEIAHANQNINGVTESLRKFLQKSFQVGINLKYMKQHLTAQDAMD